MIDNVLLEYASDEGGLLNLKNEKFKQTPTGEPVELADA